MGIGAAAVSAVLAPIVVPAGLGLVGFGAAGPIAGGSPHIRVGPPPVNRKI